MRKTLPHLVMDGLITACPLEYNLTKLFPGMMGPLDTLYLLLTRIPETESFAVGVADIYPLRSTELGGLQSALVSFRQISRDVRQIRPVLR